MAVDWVTGPMGTPIPRDAGEILADADWRRDEDDVAVSAASTFITRIGRLVRLVDMGHWNARVDAADGMDDDPECTGMCAVCGMAWPCPSRVLTTEAVAYA